VMILYSHIWDLILKLLSIRLVLAILVALHVDRTLGVWPMIGILVVVWIPIYRQGLSTIASWLYARVGLGADASLSEARRLARLFQFDVSLKWVPMKGVKKLAKPERKAALMAALEAALPTRKAMLV
jgi:hypothetical protein